jgi:uncharacterized protein (DUF427 family)
MYELIDKQPHESDVTLLAQAETIAEARYAARTMADEGTPCPIYITLDDVVRETLVDGPHGRMIQTGDHNRLLR